LGTTSPDQGGNLLLAALSEADRLSLTRGNAPIDLVLHRVLNDHGDRIRHAYFPIDSSISLIAPGGGRELLEVGLVGNEGMVGVSLLLDVNVSPLRALVQGAGRAWQVDAATFLREVESSPSLRTALNRYLYVFLAQLTHAAPCARYHKVEARLARWLLMTRDRAHCDEFRITHEFLAYMLGVRRVGVTAAASALQRRKFIRYSRGDITVLNAPGLEAAACACYELDKKIYSRILRRKPGKAAKALESHA
jgi:CRP-like cAMP-binding protein